MALRKKKDHILELDPDLLIIQECENPAKQGTWQEFSNYIWVGDNNNKGLGVFSRNDCNVKLIEEVKNDVCRYVLPVKVTSNGQEIIVIAVWAMNDTLDRKKRYIAQVYTAVKYYNNLFDDDTIVLGDFNWNHIWDISPDGPLYGNLADTRDILNNNGIFSLYHKLRKEKFGKELVPTFYMYKKRNRGYHIDYIFAHKDMINNIIDFWVGKYEKWIEYSDHMPLFFETSN